MQGGTKTEKAVFAAGCFWGVEDEFMHTPGVVATRVGYTGGETENPSYEEVCAKGTGHAEAVEVTFDPSKVTYDELLNVFWNSHNPTTLNRQGPDVGSQYRSAIFTTNPDQASAAQKSLDVMDGSGKWDKPIVTEIAEAGPFYEAEEYHQQYNVKNGRSCHI